MKFEFSQYAYFFVLIPLMLGLLFWSDRKRKADLERLGSSVLVSRLLSGFRPRLALLRGGLLILGVLFLLIALLGPTWGFTWEKVTHRGLDLVIAMDASKSMLAEDVKPSRLERSRLVMEDIVNQLQGDRVGLVTFAGTSFLQVPLTVDYNAFLQSVTALTPDVMPQGGTAIASALKNALQAFENVDAQNKVIVLFTDGENHEGDPLEVAREAKKAGVQLIIVGTGSKEGDLIPVSQNGQRGFLKDESGNIIKSSLDEKLLQSMASAANGVYIPIKDAESINSIYERYIGKFKKGELNSTRKRNFHERYQIFLLIGIIFLSAEMLLGIRRRETHVR